MKVWGGKGTRVGDRGGGETRCKTSLLELLNLENIRCVGSVVQSLNNAQAFISHGQLWSLGSQRMKSIPKV